MSNWNRTFQTKKKKKKIEIGPKGIELVIPLSYLSIFINNNNNQEEEEEEEEEEGGGGDDDDDDARWYPTWRTNEEVSF